VIKYLSAANRHPTNRSLEDFQRYWVEGHGALAVNMKFLKRYVQHLTLPEAYGAEPVPTYDGASVHWVDDLDVLRALPHPSKDPWDVALREAVLREDPELFDRSLGWPRDHKRAWVTGDERVVLEGETTPDMVKAIFLVSRHPGLTLDDFFDHWRNVHGTLCARVPGLRRYIQNHAIPEAYSFRQMTHDGWSELWFDDLHSMRAAMATPEWQAVREDSQRLFARPLGCVIARELTLKWGDFVLRDGGAAELSEEEIRGRLRQQGYKRLAGDAAAPAQIKAAAQKGALLLWTEDRIVTVDLSRIDARPEK
jgi:uncharacterized protein (TIGR02118 family)